MRGADVFSEQLFTIKRLEEFIPASHPLRPVREMVNEALRRLDGLFEPMYEPSYEGSCPSIAPEKLAGAMLLQVFYNIRSERQLMEQVQYKLLFRWFIGLSMDDTVRVSTVFSKNRERLIEHDVVVALFNEIVAMADARGWLSGEHFSVDGTLMQAWAGHKSFVRKDGGGDGDGDTDFQGKSRGNDTHACTTDPETRVTRADGHAEHEAAKVMIGDARQANPDGALTLGADKGYDAAEFVEALQEIGVAPHIAQNTSNRRSAVPDVIATSAGYAIAQTKRKMIEWGFGWAKLIGSIRQVIVRGLATVDQIFMLNMIAYNLVRMRTLGQLCLQSERTA